MTEQKMASDDLLDTWEELYANKTDDIVMNTSGVRMLLSRLRHEQGRSDRVTQHAVDIFGSCFCQKHSDEVEKETPSEFLNKELGICQRCLVEKNKNLLIALKDFSYAWSMRSTLGGTDLIDAAYSLAQEIIEENE